MNAKEEFIELIKGKPGVKCCDITRGDTYYANDDNPVHNYILKVNHTKEDFEKFLLSLNFNYHDGFGGQELFGTIWFEDGIWATRGEYDGSEWWNYNKLPDIPPTLY